MRLVNIFRCGEELRIKAKICLLCNDKIFLFHLKSNKRSSLFRRLIWVVYVTWKTQCASRINKYTNFYKILTSWRLITGIIYIHLTAYLYVCLSICRSFVSLAVFLSVCLPVYLSVCLFGCLAVCLFVCLSIYLSVCLPICLFFCNTVCLFVFLFVCLYVGMSIYLSVSPTVYLSVCLSIYISIYLNVTVYDCIRAMDNKLTETRDKLEDGTRYEK